MLDAKNGIAALIMLAGAAACTNAQPSSEELAEGGFANGDRTVHTRIATQERTYTSTDKARLRAFFYPAGAHYEVSFGGRAASGEHWSLAAYLTGDEVRSGRLQPRVSAGGIEPGVASLFLSRGEADTELEGARAGTTELLLGAGTLTGTVTADPTAWSGDVHAALDVECWVPVPSDPNDRSQETGDTTLAPDDTLEAPQCAPLRAYRSLVP